MRVVKLGGSLHGDALLPQWLALVAECGAVLVSGGGRYADEVRSAQQRWGFDDLAAHNMAVLAMAQGALLCRALQPQIALARDEPDIARLQREGRACAWMPLSLLREASDELTSWDTTSDSLALWLAKRLKAEALLVVKSCQVDASRPLAQLAEARVLDARFPALARDAAFPIELLHKAEIARARQLLHAAVRSPGPPPLQRP